jgi:polyisoprenoid-binding protein YceI
MMKRILIIGLAVLLLGAAVVFALDNTVFAPVAVSTAPPAAPTLDRSLLPAAPTPASSIATAQALPGTGAEADNTPDPVSATVPAGAGARLYIIDSSQSEVRYEVGEVFFQDNRFVTAVGRTQGVAGEILVNFTNPAQSQVGEIVIDVSQFTSDEQRRDNYLRRSGLESSVYPTASFTSRSIEGLPAQVSSEEEISFTMHGDLTVRNITQPVTWIVTLRAGETRLEGVATTQILMSDFNVGPIQLAFLRTDDEVDLVFEFVALSQ